MEKFHSLAEGFNLVDGALLTSAVWLVPSATGDVGVGGLALSMEGFHSLA